MPIRPVSRPAASPETPTAFEPEAKRIGSPRARTRPDQAAIEQPVESRPNRNPDGSYIIGKGKPPPEHRFKPNQSGNPKGRPKGARGVNTLTIEVLGEKHPVRTASGEKRMNAPEISLHKLREAAAKGDVRAMLAILDRWQMAVPDAVRSQPGTLGSAAPLSAADQQILDMFLSTVVIGVVDERISTRQQESYLVAEDPRDLTGKGA